MFLFPKNVLISFGMYVFYTKPIKKVTLLFHAYKAIQ